MVKIAIMYAVPKVNLWHHSTVSVARVQSVMVYVPMLLNAVMEIRQ